MKRHLPAKTKIICTIGPSCNTEEKICELVDAGMNVARLNFSHGSHDDHRKVIEILKKVRAAKNIPLCIMLDTKGPEIRVINIQGGKLEIQAGMQVSLVKEKAPLSSPLEMALYPDLVIDQIEVGDVILFDDGAFKAIAQKKEKDRVTLEFVNGGLLKNHKGINIPHGKISIPMITDKDIEDIAFGCKEDVDIIAASFVCSAEHVLDIKRLLTEYGQPNILVMAKIESAMGVKNFDSIVHVSDGIMVARGDLGVEMPIEDVPILQKEFITKCYRASKPVAIATQMLESMINNPRPTRAEVSDVANAIFDAASCVMLSGETAVGKYPIETVALMKQIIDKAESHFKYRDYFFDRLTEHFYDVSSAVSAAVVKTSYSAEARGIIVCTIKGPTARSISRFRPALPILAVTPLEKTYHQMAMNWGIIPLLYKAEDVSEAIHHASCTAMEKKILCYGDLVVVSSGSPFNVSGSTNTMLVDIIGHVLVRGLGHGNLPKIQAQVTIVLSGSDKAYYSAKNKVIVLSTCDETYRNAIKHAKGIILQNHIEDHDSEKIALALASEYNLPIITRADNALGILQENQFITLDSHKGIVFKGSISSDEEMYAKMCEL